MPPIPTFPISADIPRIKASLREHAAMVLSASPGAGKTTILPPAILGEEWLGNKKILMLQPRRLAARMAATRIAALRGENVGDAIGYQVRFDRQIGPATRLEILTEGLLTRRLQSDPFLEDVGLIIFDEFHERSIHADLGLALAREIQQTVRPDLKLLVMSATLDTRKIAAFLGQAPIIEVPGFLHPVSIRYSPVPFGTPPAAAAEKAVRQVLNDPGVGGDLLVFLPGEGEIYRCLEQLQTAFPGNQVLFLPLHGSLPPNQQDQVLRPQPQRRVILATNIAETSLTIEGITIVIDAGWRRTLRLDPQSGFERLELERISRASADQRAGRAGRLGPGLAIRLWSDLEHQTLEPFTPPEILRADLTETVLELSLWGKHDPTGFGWFEAPPVHRLQQATELLRSLQAIAPDGTPTRLGRDMARLPLHPRLSRLLLEAARRGIARPMCDLAAFLSERSLAYGGRQRPGALETSDCDLFQALDQLDLARDHHFKGSLDRDGFDGRAAQRLDRVARQLADIIRQTRPECPPPEDPQAREQALLQTLLVGFPDRVARARSLDSGETGAQYLLTGGKGLSLSPHSTVRGAPFLIALNVDGVERSNTQVGLIRQAARIAPEWLERLFPAAITRERVIDYDRSRQAVSVNVVTRYLDLPLREQRAAATFDDAPAVARLLAPEALKVLLDPDRMPEDLQQFFLRLQLIRTHEPRCEFPAFDQTWFAEHAEDLIRGSTSLNEVLRLNFQEFCNGFLTHRQKQDLQRLAPDRLEVPTGSRIRLRYQYQAPPILAVKLQELFGLLETPRVINARVPVLIHLLSPAGRPLQVTQDLRSFWLNTYPALRREMRGQYPRHPWPEDPLSAPPQRGVRRRSPT